MNYYCTKCLQMFIDPYAWAVHEGKCKSQPQTDEDKVNNPSHYTAGGIETIDYLAAKLTPEQLEGFLVGNVLKYVSRYPYKNGLEDLKKAQWYLNKLIEKKNPS